MDQPTLRQIEIQQEQAQLNSLYKEYSMQLSQYQKQIVLLETELIGVKIKQDLLKEEIKAINNSQY